MPASDREEECWRIRLHTKERSQMWETVLFVHLPIYWQTPPAKYKVIAPDWQKEFIETKKQLAQSQALIESLQEAVEAANDIIDTQNTVLENTNQQLKVARTANARSEKVWMKRYKKFFKRSWS